LLKAVALILTSMAVGLLVAPAALVAVVGLAGVGALALALLVDRARTVHAVQRGRDDV
jgi:D-arabinose 1-dehydrogenase-like Zn-dependent alcohol dehydrogenase